MQYKGMKKNSSGLPVPCITWMVMASMELFQMLPLEWNNIQKR